MGYIETLQKVTYENLEQFLETINRNFAVIQNSPLYKGIPGDEGQDAIGAQGIRGSQFIFVKLENFNVQFPGEVSTASKINIEFINSKLQNFDSKQKLLKSLGLTEFVSNDIIVLSNSMMLSYSIIDDKFIDTNIAFNEQTNLAGNIELKIEQFVKYYVENNTAIANVQNIFSGFTTYAKNYTDSNGTYISKSLTNSSIYAPYIPGYSSTIGVKLTNHKYFGFNDTEFPRDVDGTIVFGSMKKYIDLLMNTISTAGSETLSSDYAPGVNNIPTAIFLQDTYNNGLLFGYKGKTNLKRFGSIFKNENDELIIKSDSSKNESEYSALVLHRDYFRYKKLVQFYDNLELSKDLIAFGNIKNKFIRTGAYTTGQGAEESEFGSSVVGSKAALVSEIIQLTKYASNVLVTDANGNVVKSYSIEGSYSDESQVNALVSIDDTKNAETKIISSKHYGFIVRKFNAITSWIGINVWRKNQFNTGEIPDLKLSNNLEVGNNITNDLINTNKSSATISTGKTGATHLEKSTTVKYEQFPNAVLVADSSGNILKIYSIETAPLSDIGTPLSLINNISTTGTKIPTSQNVGWLANKINSITNWITANVWRKDQFNTGEIPSIKLSDNLEVVNNIINELLNINKAAGTIITGKADGTYTERSTNIILQQFTSKVLVTDGSGAISKSYVLESVSLSSSEEAALTDATVIPTSASKIVTSNYLGWVLRKINNLIAWIKNSVYTITNFTDGTIPNLRLTQRLTTKHITSDFLTTYDSGATVGADGKQTTFLGTKNFSIGANKVMVTDGQGNLSNVFTFDNSIYGSSVEEIGVDITPMYNSSSVLTTSYQFAFMIRVVNKLKAAVRDRYTKQEIDNKIIASMPAGSIIAWVRNEIPSGWYLCDGTNGTPDLRGRFLQMEGAVDGIGQTAIGLNALGGSHLRTLLQENIPYHTHSLDRNWFVTGFAHTHSITKGFYQMYPQRSGRGEGDHDGHNTAEITSKDSGTNGSAGQYKMKFNPNYTEQGYDEITGEYKEFQTSFNETLGWGGNQAVDPLKDNYSEMYPNSTYAETNDWKKLKNTIAFDNRPACYGVKFIMKG